MEFIRPFERLTKGDAGIAGGKGASLGEMTQAGIPVPPGFVILAGAFEQFLDESNLSQELDAIFHTVNNQEIRTVELASERIQSLILAAQMPEDIATAIVADFRKLNASFVAVRSSATAEDGATAAWAGQLDTFLNTTDETLLENVKRCWASLFTPRAIFYRFEKGMHGSKISVAVVIQKMVQSEVSGIAFSVHPVTEDLNQLIIEAGFGLGEAIVSGQVTPDSFVIEKEPRRIIDKNVTFQSRALWRGAVEGNEWRELSEIEGNKPALSDEQALELAELVLTIEQHYGFPCDIEWAYEAGHFYITQSRPITTLSKKEAPGTAVNISIVFEKSYTRDTTLFLQGLWARGLSYLAQEKCGWNNPHPPFAAHYVNDGVVEIWENKQAISWLFDRILEETKDDPKWLSGLADEYGSLVARLKAFHSKEYLSDIASVRECGELFYQAAFVMSIFFYIGADERHTAGSKALALRIRESYELFGDNDTFIRKSIAKIGGISFEAAGVVLPDEIEHIPVAGVLDERVKSFVYVGGTDTFLGTLSEFVQKNSNYTFAGLPALENTAEVRGQCAYPGIVRGTARLVRKESEAVNVAQGDIIISPMTTPNFMSAMKRAAAFVTDEGGVICHAAIVAREMQKPCVIGTKFATRVFSDGDMVEVDAEKGTVRKI
ncbi:MAG: hypothetical protein JWM46_577 [Candidatus Kaiserbacteria bacterium]|nr:hypothetical protein [Candidatus Kaiserbacteria bacterium]